MRIAPLAIAGLLGACALKDLTDPPNWDLQLNVPTKSTTISVGTMLPTGVSIIADSSAFTVSVGSTSFNRLLGPVCAECVPLNGLTAPKPAFSFSANNATNLPSDVSTATLTAGTIAIVIQNGFGFDPINVAGAATPGTLVTIATDANNRQLAKDSVNGATTSLAANGTLNRTLTLSAGALKGPITITSTVNSPAGSATLINTAQQLTVTGTPQSITVSGAQVTVTNKNVSTSATEFDLSDLDSAIRDRLAGGKLLMSINNPFAVAGTLTVRFQGGTANVTKTLALATGTTTPTVEFTQSEIRSMTGNKLALTITGPVSSSAPIAVAPRDKISVTTRLELTITTEAK